MSSLVEKGQRSVFVVDFDIVKTSYRPKMRQVNKKRQIHVLSLKCVACQLLQRRTQSCVKPPSLYITYYRSQALKFMSASSYKSFSW